MEGFRSEQSVVAAPRRRLGALLRNPSVAAPAAAGALVLAAMLVRIWLTRKIAAPWIMVDELIYSELAKSIAEHGRFLIRGEPTALYSLVYPVLLAPAWLADTMATTYAIAKSINGVVMTLAAVPVFLWSRRLLGPWPAVAVTAVVLALPDFVYTGTLMTENAFFPAALLAYWAIARAVERPTLLRQGLALGAIALACGVRLQGLVLLAVYPSAAVVAWLLDRRAGDRRPLVRPYRASLAVLVAGALAFVALKLAQGASLVTGLGAYQAAGEVGYSVGSVAKWVVYHLAGMVLSSAIVGVAALALLTVIAARGRLVFSRAERAFLAVSTTAALWLAVEVGAFASRNSLRIQERAYFIVVLLFVLALALWIERGLPRPRVTTAAVLAACVGLVAALPLSSLLNYTILSDTFSLLPVSRMDGILPGGTGVLRAVMVGAAVVAAAAAWLVPRRAARPVLLGGLAAVFVAGSVVVFGSVRDQSVRVRYVQGAGDDVSWVDEAAGRDANVTYLYTDKLDPVVLWQVEFWNRSIRGVVNLGKSEPGALPETHAYVDYTTGQLRDADTKQPIESDGIVSDSTVTFTGPLAQRWPSGLELFRVAPEPRVKELFDGMWPDGWTGPNLHYTLLGCAGGRLAFHLEADPKLFAAPQTVQVHSFGRPRPDVRVPPGPPVTATVPAYSEEHRCEVELDMPRTSVPADVIPGSADTRHLGVIVRGVTWTPPAGQ